MTKLFAVSGGKGGVGKSTVAVLMANKLIKQGKRVVLCDCDIECPNDYLLLSQKLKNPVKKVYAEFPILDKNRCNKCGKCTETCRFNAIFQPPNQYPTFVYDLCSGCGACWKICPQNAIKTKKTGVGKIYLNKITPKLYLVTGLAKSGLEETGPVARETKNFAFEQAKKLDINTIIIDTAAGTHCNVIQALLNVDLAYAVTEPTPMGAYDLELILELLKELKIPAQVILNQADLGDKTRVKKILSKFKIKKFAEEIPYSKNIAEAYSKGELLNIKLK